LYNGGWGNPASGISLIEPGTLSPTIGSITLWYPNSQVFQSSILQPVGGPPVSIQWMVNGVPDPVAHADTFTYTPVISDVGNNVEAQLWVQDTTPLVHPAMAGNSLQSSHVWDVAVRAAPSTVTISGTATGTVCAAHAFTATVNPTATTPITYVWQATGQSPMTNTGNLSNTIVFTWTMPGHQSVVVTATNIGGTATDTHTIAIKQNIYLPVMLKNSMVYSFETAR
jgi:hypothetical protein